MMKWTAPVGTSNLRTPEAFNSRSIAPTANSYDIGGLSAAVHTELIRFGLAQFNNSGWHAQPRYWPTSFDADGISIDHGAAAGSGVLMAIFDEDICTNGWIRGRTRRTRKPGYFNILGNSIGRFFASTIQYPVFQNDLGYVDRSAWRNGMAQSDVWNINLFGGQTFSDSVTEAASATDTPSATVISPVSIAEAATATDTPTAGTLLPVARVEAAAATDTPTAGTLLPVTITEAATATDTPTAGTLLPVTITETAAAADSPSATVTFPVTITEAASATDTASATAVFPVSQTETGNASDSPSANALYQVTISEAGNATDTSSETDNEAASITETGNASDSSDSTAVLVVNLFEAGAATDDSDATVGGGPLFATSGAGGPVQMHRKRYDDYGNPLDQPPITETAMSEEDFEIVQVLTKWLGQNYA